MLAAVDLNQGIQDAWADIATFVPKLLGFLAVIVIGLFVAKALSKAADAILERAGFDRIIERGGLGAALRKGDYDASTLVSKVIYYALVLLVMQFAFGLFGDNPISALISSVVAYLPRVFVAIVIVVVAAAIAKAVKDVVAGSLGSLEYGRTLATFASVSIMVIGAFAALDQLLIAPAIVRGLFYSMLAVVVGSAVIAIGGGGIQPMRQRWERSLSRFDTEKERVRTELRTRDGGVDLRDGPGLATTPSEETTTAIPLGPETPTRP